MCILFAHSIVAQDTPTFSMYDQRRYEIASEAMEKMLGSMDINEVRQFYMMYNSYREQFTTKQQETEYIEQWLTRCGNIVPTTLREKSLAQKWTPIYQKWQQQLKNLENNKKALMNTPSEWLSRLNVNKWTMNTARENVKARFVEWAKKGEYEKTEAYRFRLANSGARTFDSICRIVIKGMCNDKIQLLDYNADKETFSVRLVRKDNELNFEVSSAMGEVKVPIEDAKDIRNWGSPQMMEIRELTIYNNQMFPRKFKMGSSGTEIGEVVMNFPVTNSVQICYNDLGLDLPEVNNVLSGYCYDHNHYLRLVIQEEQRQELERQRAIEAEKRRQDSITNVRRMEEEMRKKEDSLIEHYETLIDDAIKYSNKVVKKRLVHNYDVGRDEYHYTVDKKVAVGVISKCEIQQDSSMVFILKKKQTMPPVKFIWRAKDCLVSEDGTTFWINYESMCNVLLVKNNNGYDMYYFKGMVSPGVFNRIPYKYKDIRRNGIRIVNYY